MSQINFVDLFSGCGGLSLGLSMAGLRGRFAIERDAMAFETFHDNFLSERKTPVSAFDWPYWLRKKAWGIDELLKEHLTELTSMQGEIEVLAGGPPCQGFSFAGRRNEFDPRNFLFRKYIEVVDAVKPMALLLENVPGMTVAHKSDTEGAPGSTESYYDKLRGGLAAIGYAVQGRLLDASSFGVPQKRKRLIVIGFRADVLSALGGDVDRIFQIVEDKRRGQLEELSLSSSVSVKDAIHDLRTKGARRQPCIDPRSPRGFEEVSYDRPSSVYQELMHRDCPNESMDSMRMARHSDEVQSRFELILKECPKGVPMHEEHRKRYGLKKHRIYPMAANLPAPTVTTLPDDVLHYEEARILTVRESARIQSFPDWFRFCGKFTTGGALRTRECPRYTQVGNAVPPLLGRAIGLAIAEALAEAAAELDTPVAVDRIRKALLVA